MEKFMLMMQMNIINSEIAMKNLLVKDGFTEQMMNNQQVIQLALYKLLGGDVEALQKSMEDHITFNEEEDRYVWDNKKYPR